MYDTTEIVMRETRSSLPKYIKGIRCDVKNCVYHDGESFCCAEKIKVGPASASSVTDTVCATFKQREMRMM